MLLMQSVLEEGDGDEGDGDERNEHGLSICIIGFYWLAGCGL